MTILQPIAAIFPRPLCPYTVGPAGPAVVDNRGDWSRRPAESCFLSWYKSFSPG